MSNVLINDATMTAIANAIRTKNGDSGRYTPYDMVGAILELETDALPEGMEAGEFTPISDTVNIPPITHSLGTIPNILLIYSDGKANAASSNAVIYGFRFGSGRFWSTEYNTYDFERFYMGIIGKSRSGTYDVFDASVDYITESSTQMDMPYLTTKFYKSGVTYKWLAIVTEDDE